MHLVIYEETNFAALAPLTLSRPVFSLLAGTGTLLEKQLRRLAPERVTLWVRPEMEDFCRRRIVPGMAVPTAINQPLDDKSALLLNGRMLPAGRLKTAGQEGVDVGEDGVVRAAWVNGRGLTFTDALQGSEQWQRLGDLPRWTMAGRMVSAPWDLIGGNEQALVEDFASWAGERKFRPAGAYHLINESAIVLGRDAILAPGCVLDASKGPIVVDEGANVGANSVLEGPCYLGAHATVRPLTLIRGGCSIGDYSKVGGEISNTIILGYSNKAHDGFLGDSYLGEWVNLGAGTCTSNLKNTYGPIDVNIGSRRISTGRRFLGALIGDHSKTAILTRLMTGSYVGFCCMLSGSAPAPRFVPSFTFWTDRGAEAYQMDRACEVARRVFARRNRAWTEEDERLMQYARETAARIES